MMMHHDDRKVNKENIVIIGAGVAGMAAAKELRQKGEDPLIIEKEDEIGGLCRSFSMGGEWFDLGGHATFTKDECVRRLLEEKVDYNNCHGIARNYKKGKYIKHPVQNNLAVLETKEKVQIISDYVRRPHVDGEIDNYKTWLDTRYGRYFSENYPALYTRKYWTVSPDQMETEWIGVRMYEPTLEEVLFGSYEIDTPDVVYSGCARYPKWGGFESFLTELKDNLRVIKGRGVVSVDILKHVIELADGTQLSYNKIINTAPLPDIIKAIPEAPEDVIKATQRLACTSMVLVSLCVKGNTQIEGCYIYDQDIIASRFYSTNNYSGKYSGISAFQAEIYYSKYAPLNVSIEEVKERAIEDFERMGLFEKKDILFSDVRMIPYANVIFVKGTTNNRGTVRDWLEKQSIYCAGRFGEWDYLWSDQSILSGQRVARAVGDLG